MPSPMPHSSNAFNMPHSSNTWPQSGHARRRDTLRFDPFSAGDVWSTPPPSLTLPPPFHHPSPNLVAPRAQKIERPLLVRILRVTAKTPTYNRIHCGFDKKIEQEDTSPEHISSMLRSLGITPSPGPPPIPAPIRVDHDRSPSSITPPALSPTTQIMSLGSSSSIHTPTLARMGDPLFTPTSSTFDHTPLFGQHTKSTPETPTKARLRIATSSDEIFQPNQISQPNSGPHSRKSTGGASNQFGAMAPRHVALALQSSGGAVNPPASPATSHERVMSWMQRQGLSPRATANPGFGSNSSPRQDWVFGSPQVAMNVVNPLPPVERPMPQAVAQPKPKMVPQPQPHLPGTLASVWAPRPSVPNLAAVTGFAGREERRMSEPALNEPINFLRLLQPSSQPPYMLFVTRIVKNSDQQASIFLQQKLKAATSEEARRPIIDAIVAQGFDMMTNRFGNWAIQRCLEAPCTLAERTRVAEVMKGYVVELATNCYGTHVVQKALDCAENIQMFVVAEMLQGDLAATLMNKHASHVWTKIMELSWNDPAPPIFDYVNKAMQGRWADLARHETGSLIVQHAFENLDEADKADCVREVLESIGTLATDQWGSWVVQHLLENGTNTDRAQAIDALVEHIALLSVDPQGIKAIEKAIKSGGPQAIDKVVRRLSESSKGGRRPLVVDMALGSAGSQLVSMLLPMLEKSQWSMLHDSVRGHIVTLKGSKSGSRVVWLFERTKSQHGN